jgi:hypothetical protein
VMCCADGADNLIFTAWEVRARLHTDDIYWRGNILRRGLVLCEEIFAVISILTSEYLGTETGLDWTGQDWTGQDILDDLSQERKR